MSIDNDLLHRGIENRHSPVYSSLYMSFFSLHFCQRYLHNCGHKFAFDLQNNRDKLYCGIENQLSFFFQLYLFTFFSLYASNTSIFL